MRVKVLGKIWNLRFAPLRQYQAKCEHPEARAKEIVIRSSLKGERKLDAILHELMHAGNWHLDEEFVDQWASDVARVLWKLGYREQDKA